MKHSEILVNDSLIVIDMDFFGYGFKQYVVTVFNSDTGSEIESFYTYSPDKAIATFDGLFQKYAAFGKIVYSDGKFFN